MSAEIKNPARELEYYNKWLNLAREIVLKNIDRSKYAVFLYGSMVSDPLNAYDMDIGFLGQEKLPVETRISIEEELRESIVPFRFDLVDFKDTEEQFRNIAFKEVKVWNKPDHITLR
jgi:hypothetical protein